MLIGITGKAGAGKDTVGQIFVNNHGFVTRAFATPIKKTIARLLGVADDMWDDRYWKERQLPVWNKSPRELAQTLGTEWGRRCIHDNIWIDLALADLDYSDLCITDVRFPNEATIIREESGHIVHVHRAISDASTPHFEHSSEEGIGNPSAMDFHINNFGEFDDLEEQVNQVIKRILTIEAEARSREASRKKSADKAAAAHDASL